MYSSWCNKLSLIAGIAVCGSALGANDTIVPASGSLVLETEGGSFINTFSSVDYKLIANDGSRLIVPKKSDVENILPGFSTFTGRTSPVGWPESDCDWFSYCDYLRTISSTIWRLNNADSTLGVIPTELCSAYWTISAEEAGTYSFWENFMGCAMIVLDDQVVLRDVDPTAASARRGVSVSAGTHTLTLAFCATTSTGRWGPNDGFPPAFRFSKDNVDLLADPSRGVQWDPSVHNLKARFPVWAARYSLMNILVANGRIGFENPSDSGFERLRFTGGLQGGGTVVVKGFDQVEFGEVDAKASDYRVFDGEIEFEGENAAAGRVVFTNMVKFVRVPVADRYDFSQLADYTIACKGDATVDSVRFGGKVPSVVSCGRVALQGFSLIESIAVESGATLILTRDVTVRNVRGSGTLVAPNGVTVTLEDTDRHLNLRAEGTGRFELVEASTLIARDFSDDISLWFDASVRSSLVGYKSRRSGESLPDDYTHYTNGYPIVEKWTDRRPSQQTWCAFNVRHVKFNQEQHYPQLYPFVVTNGLNGLDYVSFGACQNEVAERWRGNGPTVTKESRRLPFTHCAESQVSGIDPVEQRARFIVMVFGSQQGGGSQIIGRTGASETATAFFRAGTTTASPFMKSTAYPLWVNATSVAASTTCPNGGWQILSIDCSEGRVGIAGLGWGTDGSNNSGGQNYAEVLIFTNALTTASRQRVERYLARKWGLEDYPDGGVRRLSLSGDGVVAIRDETVAVDGAFAGTLQSSGGRIVVSPQLPDETAIANTDPLHWFDPSARDSVVLSKDVTPASKCPDCVWGLYDRRSSKRQANDFYLYAPAVAGTDEQASPGVMDRRPRCVCRSAGGATVNWLDYANDPARNDPAGNMLRLGKLKTANTMFHGNDHTESGNNQTASSVRTGFIVQDSSRGGGVPFADTVGMTGLVKERNVNSAQGAIYAANTDSSLKNGRVWLNGASVNPATTGFTGAAEVLAFETTSAFPILCFAYYNGDYESYKGGQEIQSEILLYDSVLPDQERKDIEAYLAYKWMGSVSEGYGDWSRGLSVEGTGSVVLTGEKLVFVADREAETLSPTYDFGQLSLEANRGVFAVDVSKGLAPGEYPLVRGKDLSALSSWSVTFVGGKAPRNYDLVVSPTEISLRVCVTGFMIYVR